MSGRYKGQVMVIYIASQCQGFKLEHRLNDFQKNLKGFVKKIMFNSKYWFIISCKHLEN